jgi:hypothetical protein
MEREEEEREREIKRERVRKEEREGGGREGEGGRKGGDSVCTCKGTVLRLDSYDKCVCVYCCVLVLSLCIMLSAFP